MKALGKPQCALQIEKIIFFPLSIYKWVGGWWLPVRRKKKNIFSTKSQNEFRAMFLKF